MTWRWSTPWPGRWCWAALLPLTAAAMPPGPAPQDDTPLAAIEQAVVRYASTGRSNVRLHLSPAGDHAMAQTIDNGDGTATCRVAGLRPPPRAEGVDPADHGRRFAAIVIHETTHCLLDSHAADPPPPGEDAASSAAQRLQRLTQESIADARSVIEIARRDGLAAAQRLVDGLLPARLLPPSPSHATSRALREALAEAARLGSGPGADEAAFAAAIDAGRRAAETTLREDLARAGQAAVADAPPLMAVRQALDAALQRAQRAFEHGIYANDAFTLRAQWRQVQPGDLHVFVGLDGSLRHLPVIDAEGAHDRAQLASLLAGPDLSIEHRLAVHWLQRVGRLDAAQLCRLRIAIARVLPPLRGPADEDWARRIFERTLDDMAGGDASAVLEEASQRLRAGPPG